MRLYVSRMNIMKKNHKCAHFTFLCYRAVNRFFLSYAHDPAWRIKKTGTMRSVTVTVIASRVLYHFTHPTVTVTRDTFIAGTRPALPTEQTRY